MNNDVKNNISKFKINDSEKIEIFAKDDSIIILTASKKYKAIQELFKDYKMCVLKKKWIGVHQKLKKYGKTK